MSTPNLNITIAPQCYQPNTLCSITVSNDPTFYREHNFRPKQEAGNSSLPNTIRTKLPGHTDGVITYRTSDVQGDLYHGPHTVIEHALYLPREQSNSYACEVLQNARRETLSELQSDGAKQPQSRQYNVLTGKEATSINLDLASTKTWGPHLSTPGEDFSDHFHHEGRRDTAVSDHIENLANAGKLNECFPLIENLTREKNKRMALDFIARKALKLDKDDVAQTAVQKLSAMSRSKDAQVRADAIRVLLAHTYIDSGDGQKAEALAAAAASPQTADHINLRRLDKLIRNGASLRMLEQHIDTMKTEFGFRTATSLVVRMFRKAGYLDSSLAIAQRNNPHSPRTAAFPSELTFLGIALALRNTQRGDIANVQQLANALTFNFGDEIEARAAILAYLGGETGSLTAMSMAMSTLGPIEVRSSVAQVQHSDAMWYYLGGRFAAHGLLNQGSRLLPLLKLPFEKLAFVDGMLHQSCR